MKRLVIILGVAVALSGFMAVSARAGLMAPSVTFNLTNFPGASSITATLGGGLSTVGDVQVFIAQVPTGGGGEWDDFYFSTVDGGPLAADSTLNWEINALFTLTQAVNFNGIEDQWTTGGFAGTPVPVTSLNPSGFINFAGTGPLGVGYVNGFNTTGVAFSDPIASGPQDFSTFVDPYSYATTPSPFGGGIPLDANGFNIAFHFDPQQTPIPEPATLIIWSLLGAGSWLGMRVWRRRPNMGPVENVAFVTGSVARQPWSPEARQAIHQIIARNIPR